MTSADNVIVWRLAWERTPPKFVPVRSTDLVCDGCGADAGTDEPGRGLYYDTDAEGQPCVRCRCGRAYFSTRTEERISRGTLRLIAGHFPDLREGVQDTLYAETTAFTSAAALGALLDPADGWRRDAAWYAERFGAAWVNPREWGIVVWVDGAATLSLYPDETTYRVACGAWAQFFVRPLTA